ncbi:MAG: hypothetical protein ACXWEW_08825 [Nitrososphaeraceae archaeon]
MHLPKNTGKYLILIGLILIIAGIVFTMQSKSIVGPPSSFMYKNPEWTVNGYAIITLGTIIIVVGIILWQIRMKKSIAD